MEEEELEGVEGLGHPPGVMSSSGRAVRVRDVFPAEEDVTELQELSVNGSRLLILQGPFQVVDSLLPLGMDSSLLEHLQLLDLLRYFSSFSVSTL